MSILLSDKSLLELPNEMINQIISFLPKHPIANLLFYHMYYSGEEDGIPFYHEYFNALTVPLMLSIQSMEKIMISIVLS